MALTSFTTYADIRSILGVSADELPDADLGLETYLFSLEASLNEVSPNLQADYATANAAYISNTASNAQKAFYKSTRLYSALQVSLKVAHSLAMRAEKSITDGKAGSARFTDAPIKQMLESLLGLLASAEANLKVSYATLNGKIVLPTIPGFMSIVVPAVDPVTG